MYLIHSKYIQDILDDWTGDCNFVPANDARVFFASWDGKPISPYEYTDFESLAWYASGILSGMRYKTHLLKTHVNPRPTIFVHGFTCVFSK